MSAIASANCAYSGKAASSLERQRAPSHAQRFYDSPSPSAGGTYPTTGREPRTPPGSSASSLRMPREMTRRWISLVPS